MLEIKIQRALRHHFRTSFRGGHAAGWVEREVAVGSVIPDLVAIRSRSKNLTRTQLSYFEASIVAALLAISPGRQALLPLANRLQSEPKILLRSLSSLIRRGLVDCLGHQYGAVLRSWPSAEIVAVEAKVVAWRAALRQALGYLAFADKVLIALPQSVAIRSEVRTACRAEGVGLMAYAASSGLTRMIAPRQSQAGHSSERLRLLAYGVGLRASSLTTRANQVA